MFLTRVNRYSLEKYKFKVIVSVHPVSSFIYNSDVTVIKQQLSSPVVNTKEVYLKLTDTFFFFLNGCPSKNQVSNILLISLYNSSS